MSAALALDEARVEAFRHRIADQLSGAVVTLLLDVGRRAGLLDALDAAPSGVAQLAARTGLPPASVADWLGAMVTAGIVEAAGPDAYVLPPEHAVALCGHDGGDLSRYASLVTALAGEVAAAASPCGSRVDGADPGPSPQVADAFDEMSRAVLDASLAASWLPLLGPVLGPLRQGGRVADVGTGSGHSTNLLARALPQATVVGIDCCERGLEQGRAEAASWGLRNVVHRRGDLAALPSALEGPFDLVCAVDVVGDQDDPAAALRALHASLAPGGALLMVDVRIHSDVAANTGNPIAPAIYGGRLLRSASTRSTGGGTREVSELGARWGAELAHACLLEAGFRHVEIHEIPDDPFHLLYIGRA